MAKILVIDDDYRLRTLVKSILRRQTRHEVLDEAEGKFGLEQAVLSPPNLILLDVGLPDMDGLEVCRRLKANPKTRHIPVVMLTGHGAADDVVKAYQSGADDYIVKPFETALLLAKVDKHMGATVVIMGKSVTTEAVSSVGGEKESPAGAQAATGQKQPAGGTNPAGPDAVAPAAGPGSEAKKSLRSQVAERQNKRGGVL